MKSSALPIGAQQSGSWNEFSWVNGQRDRKIARVRIFARQTNHDRCASHRWTRWRLTPAQAIAVKESRAHSMKRYESVGMIFDTSIG